MNKISGLVVSLFVLAMSNSYGQDYRQRIEENFDISAPYILYGEQVYALRLNNFDSTAYSWDADLASVIDITPLTPFEHRPAVVAASIDTGGLALRLPHLYINGSIYYAELSIGSNLNFTLDLERTFEYPQLDQFTELAGAWTLGDTTAIFGDDGYSYSVDACGRGVEAGTYSFDKITGFVAFKQASDANGNCGFSNPEINGGVGYRFLVDGNTLDVSKFSSRGEDLEPYTLVRTQVLPGAVLAGTWVSKNDDGSTNDTIRLVLGLGGSYSYIQNTDADGEDSACAGTEQGTYAWNPSTSVFTATRTTEPTPTLDETCRLSADGTETFQFDGNSTFVWEGEGGFVRI